MQTTMRHRIWGAVAATAVGAVIASTVPTAALAATYPSDTNPPNLVNLLGGFADIWHSDGKGTLHGDVVDAATSAHNDEMTVWINGNATAAQQFTALQDANYDAALLVSTGLGTTLQPLYLAGMQNGSLPKTRDLMNSMAAYANTDAAKSTYNFPRPFLATDPATTGSVCDPASYNASSLSATRAGVSYADAQGNLDIRHVADATDSTGVFTGTRSIGAGYGGYCASASFPSGHTTNAYLSGLTLATLLPELAPGILARTSEMGMDRIVLGMHYTLDVMGGRVGGTAEVAERWADTQYRRDLIEPARQELVAYLQQQCGGGIADCADAGSAYTSDPFGGAAVPGGTAQTVTDAPSAVAAYRERMTFGFAQSGAAGRAASVPATAAALLTTAYPTLTDAQRTSVLAQTEIDSGYPLDRTDAQGGSWQRLDLAAALSATVRLNGDGSVDVLSTGGTPGVVPADGKPVLSLPGGSTVATGASLSVAAAGLAPKTAYRAAFSDAHGSALATLTTDAAGGLSGAVAIPADADLGDRTLDLLDGTGATVLSTAVTVVGERVYPIATEADLDLLRQHPDATFDLTADIRMTKNWTPVPSFTGTLRGNGHTLTGLRIATSDEQGLIVINSGTISQLGFVDADSTVSGDHSAAVLATQNRGTIDQVFVLNGSVTGGHRSGLITANNLGTVSNSYSSGRASADWETGGITAWNDSSATVRNTYSTANVTAGYANVGIITGVGNTGATIAGNVVLGGAVLGGSNSARVVGVGTPTLRDNLALNTATVLGRTVSGASDSLNGADTSAAALADPATYAAIGWDLDGVWSWNAALGRPVLRAVPEPAAGTVPDATAAYALMPRAISQVRNTLPADADRTVEQLTAASAATGAAWKTLVADWEKANTSLRIDGMVPAGLPTSGHVFIVLGYALASDGSPQQEMVNRLQQAKKALDVYPASRILVAGGAPQNGKTEASVMRAWLIDNGISADRILVEDKSTDTPTNAVNSMGIVMADRSITSYTLISSASHLRRATVLFEAAALAGALKSGATTMPASVRNLAYLDTTTAENAPGASERDLIAQNVAKVWNVTAEYNAYNAQLRVPVARMVYDQRVGDDADALRALAQLRALSPEYADRVALLSGRLAGARTMSAFSTVIPTIAAASAASTSGAAALAATAGTHTFIVPGAALNDDGSLTSTSTDRLQLAFQALAANPASTVTVVGGAPKNNQTEAGAQRDWLLANGVDPARIIVVDTSSSLVEGAQQSMVALGARGVTAYTVITSASVLRRTLSVYAAGATYAASQNPTGVTPQQAGHIAVMDDASSQGAPSAGVMQQIAENVSDVLGIRSEYNAFASAPPAAPALQSIAVTAPAKTAYVAGDALDTAGLTVVATYADASTLDVTALATASGYDPAAIGAQTVTIAFAERGVTATATFEVTVRAADIADLQEAIDRAAAITADGWTPDSYAALQEAFAAARAVVADPASDVDAVNAARVALVAAIDGLVRVVPAEPGGEPTPGGTEPGATAPSGGAGTGADSLASTGSDLTAALLAAGMLLLLGAGAFAASRRRRGTQQPV